MEFDTFLSDVVATIIGGVVLAILFFWFRERVFPLPRINGRWYFEMRTCDTSYKPYEEMVLRYVAMLWREDGKIQGTVEKIYEKASNGEREYVGQNRTRGTVEGYIQKNYFGQDRLFLHVIEEGHGRESTSFYELIADSNEIMSGSFSSMIANQNGTTIWQRKEF